MPTIVLKPLAYLPSEVCQQLPSAYAYADGFSASANGLTFYL
jgi:hypothetical protein